MMEVMDLPKTAQPIKGAVNHWIDVDGSVYAIDSRNNHPKKLIKKAFTTCHGYSYCGIKYEGQTCNVSKRVHRLVAETFIPNPNNYTVVGHKNNIKNDNRVENLYWTTTSENTKKAFDDGLAKNDKGFDDSQSLPVIMYNTYTNERVKEFGSCREAHRETKIPLNTICRQAKYKRPSRKPFYFRYIDDECTFYEVVGMFNYDSDALIRTFINCSQASDETGISERTICQQTKTGKPSIKRNEVYFKRISSN